MKIEEKLLKVEEAFLIKGRGFVTAGLLENNAPNFKIGDKIKFYCFDNSITSSEVAGFEMINFGVLSGSDRFRNIAFSVCNLNDKSFIVKGATVYLVK